MERPQVARGRVTNARTRNFVEFMLNPSSIKETKGSNFVENPTPGFSDPKQDWASGKVSTIKFDVDLCGETGLRIRRANLTNGAFPDKTLQEAATTYSIAGEIEFFESFMFPVDPELATRGIGGRKVGGPDKAIFTFGRRYQGVVCWLEVDVDISEFTPELDPSRAKLGFVLRRISDTNRFAHTVWSPPAGLEGFDR